MPGGSFDRLLNLLANVSLLLPTLVYTINEIISAAELICVRLVIFGLFLYGLYRFVRRGG